MILNVPFRSQYDSSPYQLANCGPAALAMVLQAYGLDVPNSRLRAIADLLQGTTGYSDGIALDYLQSIAQQAGLRTEGLDDSTGHYRKWSMSDVIHEIRRGYPVITLVHFASLPAHLGSTSTSDHYIVVVGVTKAGFVINDPAATGSEGYRQILRPDQLIAAWSAASIQEQAVAFLPPTAQLVPFGDNTDALPATGQSPSAPAANAPVLAGPANVSPLAPSVKVNAAAGRTPPPGPAQFVASGLARAWQRASPVPTVRPKVDPSQANGQAIVLAEHDTNQPSAWPVLVVVGIIGILAVAIVKAPREEDP